MRDRAGTSLKLAGLGATTRARERKEGEAGEQAPTSRLINERCFDQFTFSKTRREQHERFAAPPLGGAKGCTFVSASEDAKGDPERSSRVVYIICLFVPSPRYFRKPSGLPARDKRGQRWKLVSANLFVSLRSRARRFVGTMPNVNYKLRERIAARLSSVVARKRRGRRRLQQSRTLAESRRRAQIWEPPRRGKSRNRRRIGPSDAHLGGNRHRVFAQIRFSREEYTLLSRPSSPRCATSKKDVILSRSRTIRAARG